MRRIRRREFLEGTAAAGVGLAVGVVPARGAQSPNERVQVGVMGLSRGLDLCRAFARTPGVVVKYVCDVDTSRQEKGIGGVEEAGGAAPEAVGDFRRILDDPEIDALVCAAPNHWHAPATILACAAGKHVYVEKPCSHDPREGEWMVEAAAKHKRCVQMGTQRRSSASTIEAIEALRSGAIGRVYLARSWYSNERPSIGRGQETAVPSNLDYELWQGPVTRRPYLDNVVHYNWHWRWHWGNGELGNNGVHALDLCRWGLGADFPIRVGSSGGRYRFDDDQETPDTHTATFDFPNRTSAVWLGLSCNGREEGFVTFYGEQGSLALDGSGGYTVLDLSGKAIKQIKGSGGGEPEHVANFVDAVRADDPSRLNQPIESGHRSTLLCHLGNIAHRVGRSLDCRAEDGRIEGDEEASKYWAGDYEPGWEPRV